MKLRDQLFGLVRSPNSLGRHQLSAFAATCADFCTMTLAHELFGLHPVSATVVGASVGGIINFQLGRHWVFGARQGAVFWQALRYAAVSFGCVLLNASGMAALSAWFGSDSYLAQRAVVSLAASVAWSYPAQRWLVFNVRHKLESEPELVETPRDFTG
jgi:putative flippase GtrA